MLGQRFVAQPARRGFDSLARPCGNLYPPHDQGYAKLFTNPSARVGPRISIRAEAVMDMKRGKAQACVGGMVIRGMKQNGGIESA